MEPYHSHTGQPIQFSVVIPAYNAANTIAKAIQSCLQQSYPPHEIIIVDDASTDNMAAIIKSDFASHVRYVRLHKNEGAGVARNHGIATATGNYIAFLDADDTWHPEKLFISQMILAANPGIKFFYHQYTLTDVNQQNIPEGATLYKLPFIKLLYKNMIATPCAIAFHDKALLFDQKMRHMEDYDLWLRLAYRNKVYFIDLPLTQLGRPISSQGGASSNKWEMRKGELRAFTKLTKLNPLFVFLLPFLYTYSISKHLYKAIAKK